MEFGGKNNHQGTIYHSIILNSKEGKTNVMNLLTNPGLLIGKHRRNTSMRSSITGNPGTIKINPNKMSKEEEMRETEMQKMLHRNLSKKSNRNNGLSRLFHGIK